MTLQEIKAKIRLLSHLFFKSGNLSIGMDHFLVAFPSILLIAKILDDYKFGSNSISLLLFSTGICNLLLYKVTKCKIPVFVAPSFAFVKFLETTVKSGGMLNGHINVYIGFLFAGLLFVFIAVLYQFPKIRKYIKLTLPDALVGPLISLIGLDLLETAVADAGLKANDIHAITVAAVTLGSIIVCTTFKRPFFKNVSVMIGVIVGLAASGILLGYKPKFSVGFFGNPVTAIAELVYKTGISVIDFKEVELLNLFIAIIPATLVVFSENITKITLLEKVIRTQKEKEKCEESLEEKTAENVDKKDELANFYQRSIWGHAVSFLASVIMRSFPNTVYAENVALMEINNVENYNNCKIEKEEGNNIADYYNRLSVYPLIMASILLILCSFLTFFQDVLSGIPKPVYGGMELFVFSIISAQGVQLLVDRKVNYKKITNQIITSATLLAGLSGVVIDLGVAEISGLSLGLLVGVSLNMFFKVFSYYGMINEKISVIDVLEICDGVFRKGYDISVSPGNIDLRELNEYLEGKNRTNSFLELVNDIIAAEIKVDDKTVKIVKEENENIIFTIMPYSEGYAEIKNDYRRNVERKGDSLVITFDEKFSVHKLKSSLRRI